jgi:hypothetical protein
MRAVDPRTHPIDRSFPHILAHHEHHHHRNLACRLAIRARQANGEGSNAVNPGWGDDLL